MDENQFIYHQDCRFFLGDKPCRHKRLCRDCPHYQPVDKQVLIIKLAAAGDVLRTTCLLPALAKKYPQARVTWLSDPQGAELIAHSPGVDELLVYGSDSVQWLLARQFDLAICLDKEPRAIGLMHRVEATEKRGFGLGPFGAAQPLNPGAEYAFRLGLDDELKFRQNTLTYQEIALKAADLSGPATPYVFKTAPAARDFAREFFAARGLDPARTVGLNTGAGPVFAHKAWLPERFAALADWLAEEKGLQPLLLGGPAEREVNQQIAGLCRHQVADTGGEHDLSQFAGIVGSLRLLVTSDSLAMHLGLAQRVPTLVLFGSTCPQEIMLDGPGRLLAAGLDCQPCYRGSCDIEYHCMAALSQDTVQAAMDGLLAESA